ncbi:MAG: TetR/AcrR family transcriptional regulator [Suipraeoptans sp.]
MENNNKKKSSKSEQTRLKIIDKYLDLITIKRWDKISVKELCIEVDITRGTFYQYFNDIYDLMEFIQDYLLEDITKRYKAIKYPVSPSPSSTFFEQRFDFTPPLSMQAWFAFCQKYPKAVSALFEPNLGNHYFVKKIKTILSEYINLMMDNDGMPRDSLRQHFTKVFIELHFLAARTWLGSDNEDFLSIDEIINLLNTMRVGANYLSYKEHTEPDFHTMMQTPKGE